MLFSIVAALIYIPTNSAGGFPFLHTFSITLICSANFCFIYFGIMVLILGIYKFRTDKFS